MSIIEQSPNQDWDSAFPLDLSLAKDAVAFHRDFPVLVLHLLQLGWDLAGEDLWTASPNQFTTPGKTMVILPESFDWDEDSTLTTVGFPLSLPFSACSTPEALRVQIIKNMNAIHAALLKINF